MAITTAPARMAEFRQALAAGVLTTDGAMGTMLRSILLDRGLAARGRGVGSRGAVPCLEELNLSLAALVRDVHQEFLRAGAQVLGTNTFGANRKLLSESGFGDKTRAINQAGVRIAREAARSIGAEAFVAGVVGPLGAPLEPLGSITRAEARAIFQEQMNALVESGVDLLVLETFQDLAELEEAIAAARETGGPEMTVVAQVTVEEDGSLLYGHSADRSSGTGLRGTPASELARRLEEWPVDVIGVNCSSGPRAVLETLEKLAAWTTKPLSAKPSAGLPAMVDGRTVYPCTPEYMAQYAVRFAQAGARMVGGCCGTTPEHVRQMRAALKDATPEISPRAVHVTVEDAPTQVERESPSPVPSELVTRLAARQFVAMAELWSPRGTDASQEVEAALDLKRSGMEFLVVRPARGRMSALAACHVIQQQAAIECVLDAPAFDHRYFDFESALEGACALGIRNIVCGVEGVGSTAIASSLRGSSLFVGVRLDPCAADPDQQLRWFERHVASRAAFVITEPVYDPDLLEEFLKRIEPYQLPVIAGIRPLESLREAMFLINERRTPVTPAYLDRLRSAEAQGGEGEGAAIAREMVEIAAGMAAGVCLGAHPGPNKFPTLVVDAIAARR